jgi:sec-independent protein translocase protein TatB
VFENIGWGEIMVLIIAGLFILGPERLPEAAAWLGRSMHKIREFASGARQQLRDEMGSDFEELRKPLEDLRSLRSMGPRRAITNHLLDGYDPVEDFKQYDVRGDIRDARPEHPLEGLNGSNGRTPGNGVKQNGYLREHTPAEPPRPLAPGECPPFDPDAT